MNGHSFNSAAFNGATSGTYSIRSVINMIAEAVVFTNNRVNRKDKISATAEATVINAIGRVWFRDALSVPAQASPSVIARMFARSEMVITAAGSVSILGYFRPRAVVNLIAEAQNVLSTARVLARDNILLTGQAISNYVGRVFVSFGGNAAPPQAQALITVEGLVKPQTLVMSPVSVPAEALIDATTTSTGQTSPISVQGLSAFDAGGRVWARDQQTGSAQASVSVAGLVLRLTRLLPLPVRGVALVSINSTIYRRIPFDEAAPMERTFYVAAVDNLFYAS